MKTENTATMTNGEWNWQQIVRCVKYGVSGYFDENNNFIKMSEQPPTPKCKFDIFQKKYKKRAVYA